MPGAPLAVLLGLLCAVSLAWSAAEQAPPRGAQAARAGSGPLSPEEALASFELEPGYRIELAAAEPLVRSPLAIAFDERGRLYVVENRGYPGPLEGSAGTPPALGVIARLDDTDNDGRFDTRTEFAVDLTDPNGVMPWNGGIFVSAAPDLLYLKDTNDDGVADERRVVLTGFDARRTAQIRFSHPTLGIDNWVYLTSGLTGGQVTAPVHPDRAPVAFATSDSRFHPLTHAFELTGGKGQYGLTFDDYGRRFICSNRHPVMHVVLEPWYLERNPHLAFSGTAQNVSTTGAEAVVWPISPDMTTASFHPGLMGTPHAGTFTAASGVHLHRGDALPEDHRDSIFICESAQNLVQRQVRSANGVTFASRPARTGREFLASRDSWFRPVFSANGPDGALYIVDMYRKTIDHPQYVPEPSRASLDFEAGKDRGRIYRIVRRDWKGRRERVNLAALDARGLARVLEHANGWWRDTAQRLIVERRDRSGVAELRRVAREGRSPSARIHALWTLQGLAELESADIVRGLQDRHAPVRENAVLLAEAGVEGSAVLRDHAIRLAGDPDARVRLRVALALGNTRDPRSLDALASIARLDGAESWTRAAVLSSVGGRSYEFLRAFLSSPAPSSTAARAAVMGELGHLFGAGEAPERCLDLILEMSAPGSGSGWQMAALSGMAQGLRARGFGAAGRSPFMTLLSADSPRAEAARKRVEAVLRQASEVALDDHVPESLRLPAIGLLGQTDFGLAAATLLRLLAPRYTLEIQIAAVRALTQLPDAEAAGSLVETGRWAALTPDVREAVLGALMTLEPQTMVLLEALEKGQIAPTDLAPSFRGRLARHRNPDIQKRARALFASVESGDRMQVYERLRAQVPARAGSHERGKSIFARYCATCHAFAGVGGNVGPDLSGVRNQPAEALLLHILVPDYEITPGYGAYVVETRDGRILSGRLESEAPHTVTLRDASSGSHVILRSQIASMSAATGSLMPDELERVMSPQDLADLIRYLKTSPSGPDRPGAP